MSQKFSVPKIDIDPKKFNVTSNPAFQQQMANLRATSESAMKAIQEGTTIAKAVTKHAENPPKFELDPEVKKNLASCRAACATISADIKGAQDVLDKEMSRIAGKSTPSPAAQAALGRIRDGFAHIEEVRKATQLPALKVNA